MPIDPKTKMRYVFNLIDHFTKYVWCVAFPTRDAPPIIAAIKQIFEVDAKGPFKLWQHDNGGEFNSDEMKNLIQNFYGATDIRSAPYHPQTNGVCERANQTIKGALKQRMSDNGEWSDQLANVVYKYNTSIHSTIKMTPYFAENLEHPPLQQDYSSKFVLKVNPITQYTRENTDSIILKRLENNGECMSKRHNKRAKVVTFNVGEQVLVRSGKKKDRHYKYTATIDTVYKNGKYKICWLSMRCTFDTLTLLLCSPATLLLWGAK
jgi:hypothetical protein